MSGANPATVWARALVDELARSGVTDVCLAPGSRSTPLVLAAARHGALRLRVFLDERCAAFFALGLGRATRRPAAVVTTSGTAAANLLPAAVEAALSEVPLLLITADRPPHLRGADANQSIDQVGLFGGYARLAVDTGLPVLEDHALRHLRGVACRAVGAALGAPAGPVHLNVPFEKPLEPGGGERPGLSDLALEGRPDGSPYVALGRARARAAEAELDQLARALSESSRGVVVAGAHPDATELGPRARALAAAAGMPLLADPLSGARYGPSHGATVVGSYDLLLADPAVRSALVPDLVLRVGRSPTSAHLLRWLDEHAQAPQVVIDGGVRWKDHLARASLYLRADPVDALERLGALEVGRAPADWRDLWKRLDVAVAGAAEGRADEALHEGRVLAELVRATPPGTPLFVSSSMPIRDLDAYGGDREEPLEAYGNRGASGIDGIVSTALGVAAGSGRPALAVVGDLAFLHDVNGLLATRESDARVVLVVLNNDGGGIFHRLPVRDEEPEFTRYFATPHGLELAHASALYGVDHFRVDTIEELLAAVQAGLAGGGSRVVEIATDRETNRSAHEAVRERVARAAQSVLETETNLRAEN